MKRKNGFTLIELLAVIVILAIIALIATPLVLKYIEESKKQAVKNSIISIDRVLDLDNINNKTDRQITSMEEIAVNQKNLEVNIKIKDRENYYYRVESEEHQLDITKCETKRYCTIDEVKTIKDIIIRKKIIYSQVDDDNPGIICGNKKTEDMSLDVCHIRSIEDLVAFSKLVNEGNTFSGKTIKLVQHLSFNNKKSYASGKIDKSLISGVGFTPVGSLEENSFQGLFEGNNNTLKGLYINRSDTENVGLFGNITSATIQNFSLDITNVTGYKIVGSLVGKATNSKVNNINVNNINLNAKYSHVGGLIGSAIDTNISNIKGSDFIINGYTNVSGLIATFKGDLDNVQIDYLDVIGQHEYTAGFISSALTPSTISNIKLSNVNVSGSLTTAGLIADNKATKVKKIELNDVKLISNGINTGGIIGLNDGYVFLIKANNIVVNATNDYIGGIVGRNNATISDIKFSGKVSAIHFTGLGVGVNSGHIKNVMVSGDVTGTNSVGGIVGATNGTSAATAYISGIMLSGGTNGAAATNRIIGSSNSYNTVAALSFTDVTVNGKTVISDDITSLNGKSLDDVGKVSQSDYETIGFEFTSTDTNEGYWYFNENDELDLKFK